MAEKTQENERRKSITPETLRKLTDILEDASSASNIAAIAVAPFALVAPWAAVPTAAALGLLGQLLGDLAKDYDGLADRLQQKLQGGSNSSAPPRATPNMAPRSPDSLLGPDPANGASLASMKGATKASWLPDDVIARLENASQAGQGLAVIDGHHHLLLLVGLVHGEGLRAV